ncbi:MAG: hypothetical protein KKE17_10540 [Proteobacteria bacterium]|nr:hypothetical protein [Pseudomonadota bacterium]MBU1710429.1 hypothetical protein [Pseudomonadota bacterium]
MVRKFFAATLLVMLVIIPFINWRIGALLWMCAWLVYIFQNLFTKRKWSIGKNQESEDSDQQK